MWNAAASPMGRSRRSLLVLVLALLTVLLLVGCHGNDPVVKVGLDAPFEGRHRANGY